RVGHMPSGTANNLQDFGQWPVYGSAMALYGYGLAEDDSRARRFALTDAEGIGVAAVLTAILQPAFGRRRPRDHTGHADFFSVGTTELLLYMHQRHEDEPPGRWHIFPTTDGQGGGVVLRSPGSCRARTPPGLLWGAVRAGTVGPVEEVVSLSGHRAGDIRD